MTLDQFISSKPAELRLGQFFVNSYCRPIPLGVHHYWEDHINELWNLDGYTAETYILWLMLTWQWDSLPEITKK